MISSPTFTPPLLLLLSCLLSRALAFSPTRQLPFIIFSDQSPASPPRYQPTTLIRAASLQDGAETEQEKDRLVWDEEEEENHDIKTYETNLELATLANRCARRGRQSRLLAMSAYELLQNMTYPDTVAYNSVLKAFAKSSPTKMPNVVNKDGSTGPWVTAAERSQMLLEEMIREHDAQAAASQDWYIRNAQGKLTELELERGPPRIRVKPNVRSFSTVMDAWSRTGNVEATLRVLKSLENRYEHSGTDDIALQPNIFSYNTVLAAYAKSKGGITAAEEAEYFLKAMPVEPDVISYNAALHALARSGHRQAGERATSILRSMNVAPNSRTYTTVMDAWSRSSRDYDGEDGTSPALKAHELLEELKGLYEETGDQQLKPNCISYSTVINAYALSKEPLKAQRAFELLQEMMERGQKDPHVLPNTVTYNSVLNAAATSSPLNSNDNGGVCLQNIVQTLYYQLTQGRILQDDSNNNNSKRSLEPDHFTFGTVLKACANNIFWDDPTFGMHVFEEACQRGQVSLGVLVQLRQAVPMHTFQDFLPANAYNSRTRQFSMSNIPGSWKRNVRERRGGEKR